MLAVMERVGSYSRTLEGESTPLCYDERSCVSCVAESVQRAKGLAVRGRMCVQASGSVVCSVW